MPQRRAVRGARGQARLAHVPHASPASIKREDAMKQASEQLTKKLGIIEEVREAAWFGRVVLSFCLADPGTPAGEDSGTWCRGDRGAIRWQVVPFGEHLRHSVPARSEYVHENALRRDHADESCTEAAHGAGLP